MDSPLILCNIQKCALEQVQAAVEQFGRSDRSILYITEDKGRQFSHLNNIPLLKIASSCYTENVRMKISLRSTFP